MDKEKLAQELLKIMAEVLGISKDQLNLESKREEFSVWDSLATVVIFMKIEEHFNVKFNENDIKELNSVNKILNKITQTLSNK